MGSKIIPCAFCGKEFLYSGKGKKGDPNHYCCKECQHNALSVRYKGKGHPQFKNSLKLYKCTACGKEVERYDAQVANITNIFCSKKCHSDWQAGRCENSDNRPLGKTHFNYDRVITKCRYCDKEMEVKPSAAQRKRGNFCSKECQNAWQSENIKGESHPQYFRITRRCENCGKEIQIRQSSVKKGYGKFCNVGCYGEWMHKYHRGENHPLNQKIVRKCEICGTEFKVIPKRVEKGEGRFCSMKCFGIWQAKYRVGENASHWQGGISFDRYCPKFNDAFKERVRKWYDYKCALCGEPQITKKLCVHHVYYNKSACCETSDSGAEFFLIGGEIFYIVGNPNKFVALCRSCHSRANVNRVEWAKYYEDIINNWYGGLSWSPAE